MKHRVHRSSIWWAVLSVLLVATLLASCAAPAATTAPTQPPAAPEPTKPPEVQPTTPPPTEVPPSPTPDLDFSPDIPDPAEPVTITFASWVHTTEPDDAWESLAKKFHEIHPNITIEWQDVPFEEMYDKLLAQIASNNPPDAAYVDQGTVGDFAPRNAIVNLDDYISKSKVIDRTDYVPGFLTAATYQDSMYGLPIDGETTGLFYRTDRFQEAGLDPNKPPATWEEFKQYAEKLTDAKNKKYGFVSFATEAAYYWYPWLWQAGGTLFNPDNPNDMVFDNEAGQKAANFYVDLVKYSPPDFLASNSWDGRTAFANGDVAMYIAGAWLAGVLYTEFPDANGKWSTAPLPTGEKCATTIASDDLVVFSGSKNKEAAYKWIEFVSAPENMAMLNTGTLENPATLLPPRNSLLSDPKTFEGRPFLQGFADNMKCVVLDTVVQPYYGEIEQIINDNLGQAFYKKLPDGATAIKKAAKEAEEMLAKK